MTLYYDEDVRAVLRGSGPMTPRQVLDALAESWRDGLRLRLSIWRLVERGEVQFGLDRQLRVTERMRVPKEEK